MSRAMDSTCFRVQMICLIVQTRRSNWTQYQTFSRRCTSRLRFTEGWKPQRLGADARGEGS